MELRPLTKSDYEFLVSLQRQDDVVGIHRHAAAAWRKGTLTISSRSTRAICPSDSRSREVAGARRQ